MKLLIAARLQKFSAPQSMGVVTDTRYVRCFWPALDRPTRLFAPGSSGIEVIGSSRNVVFPAGTVHLDYYPDAFYPAEQALRAYWAERGKFRTFVNLTEDEAAVWQAAYDAAVATLPATAAVHTTPQDCHFWRKRLAVQKLRRTWMLSRADVRDFLQGTLTKEQIEARVVDNEEPE